MEPRHKFSTKWVTFEHRYECASGMECKCGANLSQNEVEDAINAAEALKWCQENQATIKFGFDPFLMKDVVGVSVGKNGTAAFTLVGAVEVLQSAADGRRST